ncbi:MAG: hypothetical protein QOE70_6461 [Chthoniobacter sp.]|nr:hypothetical protein [Chthoniobacter sp.]
MTGPSRNRTNDPARLLLTLALLAAFLMTGCATRERPTDPLDLRIAMEKEAERREEAKGRATAYFAWILLESLRMLPGLIN